MLVLEDILGGGGKRGVDTVAYTTGDKQKLLAKYYVIC